MYVAACYVALPHMARRVVRMELEWMQEGVACAAVVESCFEEAWRMEARSRSRLVA